MNENKLQLKKHIVTVRYSNDKIDYIILDYPKELLSIDGSISKCIYFTLGSYFPAELLSICNALKTKDKVWAIQNLQSTKKNFKYIADIIMKDNYVIKTEKSRGYWTI